MSYAAMAGAAQRNGSPDRQTLCRITDSLRAQATRALPEPERRSIASAQSFRCSGRFTRWMKDYSCCLVHERAREPVTASGDVSTAIRLARLVAAWGETEVRTHRSRSRKSARVFNGADVHQRGESTDP